MKQVPHIKTWLDDTSPTEEMWKQVMEEDEKYDYSSPQTTPPVREEVDIYTSSSEFTHDADIGSEDTDNQ